jgi:hypothetical protein
VQEQRAKQSNEPSTSTSARATSFVSLILKIRKQERTISITLIFTKERSLNQNKPKAKEQELLSSSDNKQTMFCVKTPV